MPSTDFDGSPIHIISAKDAEYIIQFVPSSPARSRLVKFLNHPQVREHLEADEEPEWEE